MVAIIDYGMGNLRSVQKAFMRLNTEVIITSDINRLKSAEKLILPGVGHFKMGMDHLKKAGLIDFLNTEVREGGKPLLGICLGMQLLTEYSEEGNVNGLGWIEAKTLAFKLNNPTLKIPHMGWNTNIVTHRDSIFKGIEDISPFYFVHSYFVDCNHEEDILAKAHYGIEFVSAIQKNNIFGVQFHPEKSHDEGLTLIKNFIEY